MQRKTKSKKPAWNGAKHKAMASSSRIVGRSGRGLKRGVLATAVRRGLGLGGAAMMLSLSSVVQSQSTFGAVVELSDLDGSDGFVINGIATDDRSGTSVSGAGDVNGDGVADLIIGAKYADPNGNGGAGYGSYGPGESYVVFGDVVVGSTGVVELSNLDGSDGFVINGIATDDRSGISVSGAGDINGDGVADLIIGADRGDPNGNFGAGESYVVFGGDVVGSTGAVELSNLDGSDGFVINGIDANDASGSSVSGAGDVNGDGVADLIIGASRADQNGNTNAGESYVVFGGSVVGSTGVVELSNLDGSDGFVINGIDVDDLSGGSVSGAGDVNGDGVADLIIGANLADPNGNGFAGESYVVFGGGDVGGSGPVELSNLDGSDGFVINGIDTLDRSGTSVSGAGDVNGDGVADLIIGAVSAEDPNGNNDAGESYVLFGVGGIGSLGTVELSNLDGSDGFVINGIDADDASGSSVSGAGDVNGDGVADLIIGAAFADQNGNINAGESYVVFGGSGVGSTGAVELSNLDGSDGFVINGIDANDLSGVSVSGAGDVNGDGVADLIIGADRANSSAGESYVVFGEPLADDIFEEDDSFATASVIENGIAQTGRSINDGGTDIDFATFVLTCEANVVIETSGVSGDTILTLYDGNQNFVADNIDIDFDGGNFFSRIEQTLPVGSYFVMVREFDTDEEIADYTLSFDRTCLGGGNTCNGLPVTVDLNLGQTPGPGDDVVMGTPGNDDIRGRAGNDTICGMGGDDFLHGNSGDDWIDGGDGVDFVRGGQGEDILFSGSGATVGTASRVFGGTGDDTIFGGPDADDLRGGRGEDSIFGEGDDDLIIGNADNDSLNGDAGNDTIIGGAGDDELFGQTGADSLNGGSGDNDQCFTGGEAGDTDTNCEFVFD